MEKAAGDRAASPTPTPMRVRNRVVKFFASPHRQVIKLQKNTPTVMIHFRLRWSAMRAMGRPSMM